MKFLKIALFLVPLYAQADMTAEFDKGRFKNSTFLCTNNTGCNFGSCVTGMCKCTYGYRDSTEAACDHEMGTLDKTASWALEAALGWVFPVGWFYQGIWETALLRIGIELTAGGMIFGYLWKRDKYLKDLQQENFSAIGYLMGSALFSMGHFAGWIGSAYFLSRFDIKHSPSLTTWHKDLGEADLVVLADKIQDSIRVTLNQFGSDDCAIVEQCVGGIGERRLLRFDAYINNIGQSDFVMGLEEVKPVWSPCHQHFHGPDTAKYFVEHQLIGANNTVLQTITKGHKQGYCYIDSTNINSAHTSKFNCGAPQFTKQLTQGITAGWSDIYNSDTDCQWIDITDIPPGTYNLSVTVNPKGIYYQDADLTNNLSILQVEIPPVDKKIERVGNGQPISSSIIQGPRS